MTDPAFTPEPAPKTDPSPDDLARLREFFGRDFSAAELAVFSAARKGIQFPHNLQSLLDSVPNQAGRVMKLSEDSTERMLDIGDGLALVFGQSTAVLSEVGGVDAGSGVAAAVGWSAFRVVSQGAHPTGLVTSFRFASPDSPNPAVQSVLSQALTHVAQFTEGSSISIPSPGPVTFLDATCGAEAVILDAICVGLVRQDQIPACRNPSTGHQLVYGGAGENGKRNSPTAEVPDSGQTAMAAARAKPVEKFDAAPDGSVSLEAVSGSVSRMSEGTQDFRLDSIHDTTNPGEVLEKLLSWSAVLSPKQDASNNRVAAPNNSACFQPGSDADVLKIHLDALEKRIAIAVGCNPLHAALDPVGCAKTAATESVLRVYCSGATALGVLLQSRQANSADPAQAGRFQGMMPGLMDSLRVFNAPLLGISGPICDAGSCREGSSVPLIAAVGTIEKPEQLTTKYFKEEGDAIILLLGPGTDASDPIQSLGGSLYLKVVHGVENGVPPVCDPQAAQILNEGVRSLIFGGQIKSAHLCSRGGLALCLAECCLSETVESGDPRLLGASIDLTALRPEGSALRLDALLFGESQHRVVVTTRANLSGKIVAQSRILGLQAVAIGSVGGDKLTIKCGAMEAVWDIKRLSDLRRNPAASTGSIS